MQSFEPKMTIFFFHFFPSKKRPIFTWCFVGLNFKLELQDSRFPAVDRQLIFLKGVYLSVQSTLLMQKNLDVSDPCTLENLFFWGSENPQNYF